MSEPTQSHAASEREHAEFGSAGFFEPPLSVQDRPPNFRDDDGDLFIVRCFACGGEHGKENWAMAVASGQCAWCGWTEYKRL